MYKMPPEVITAERPVVVGLSMVQILGLMGGMVMGNQIADKTLVHVAFAALGLAALRRGKGLYVAENVFYLIQWFVKTRLDLDDGVLDPDALYDTNENVATGTTYVVRSPDGTKMLVSR
jgi:hypothetical protein